MSFSLSTPKEITRVLHHIRESKMGTNSSLRTIKDFDLELKWLEIVYPANGAEVEGLADSNGHRQKVVVDEKSFSWGGAHNKGKCCKCELTKYVFLCLLKLCMKKNT